MWKPQVQQFTTPIRIQRRIETDVNGAPEVSYQDADPALAFCNWKGKGGTESTEAGTLTVEDTAEIVMWYRPDVNQRDRLLLNDDDRLAYEIISPPDNVEMRNMYLILKVKRAVNA